MIVLDTSVLSALMRTAPDAVVARWLDRQPADSVWITSITVFEARFGLALLPKGRRRSRLEQTFDRMLTELRDGRGPWPSSVTSRLRSKRCRSRCCPALTCRIPKDAMSRAQRHDAAAKHARAD